MPNLNNSTYLGLVLFLVLNALDGFLTIRMVSDGLKEANPFMKLVHQKLGLHFGTVLVKLLLSVGAIYFVVVEHAGWRFLSLLIIPYALLLVWNLVQMNRIRRETGV